MKFAVFLFILGAALISYAWSLPAYKDEKLFLERYMSMSAGHSREYEDLRAEMLTLKFPMQDYGITLLAVASGVFAAIRRGRALVLSPKSPTTLAAGALGLPLLTVGSYVFDLMQASHRGEFPNWADSIGIPLMGAPVLVALLIAWALAHLCFLRRTDYFSTSLITAFSHRANWWLLFLAALTAVLALLCAASGQYWYAIPGGLWVYFYLSICAVRQVAKNERLCA